jgi:Ti-type conjugative transfer relaxase TraA
MAIYHLDMKPISRASGRSAVAAAAYRAGVTLTNDRDGLMHTYAGRSGIVHAEIVIPAGSSAQWAFDRSALWNAAEAAERRADARVAREIEIALPHELTAAQRLAATRELAQHVSDRFGVAVDFAIHAPQGASDMRNHHAHLMLTVRAVEANGLGAKTSIERENKWLLGQNLPTSQMQLSSIRHAWEGIANRTLAAAGHDITVDHRSHVARGLMIEPTVHVGVHATDMARKGLAVSRVRLPEEAGLCNALEIYKQPELILSIVTGEKSVFDRHDVARALHRAVDDQAAFQTLFTAIMASPTLVELQPADPKAPQGGTLARYATQDMIAMEGRLSVAAQGMAAQQSHPVSAAHVTSAIASQNLALRQQGTDASAAVGAANPGPRLSDEQVAAVHHVTGPHAIAAVVGYAGAGKSTMLAAARIAWERDGYRVVGGALAGKAADGLETSSGIASRTLASWDARWSAGKDILGPKDILVIDEAGMIGSKQLSRFVEVARDAGAKLVLVGDPEQLQAISAGAPFRAIVEQIGTATMQDVRRQRHDWQRGASVAFAQHDTAAALNAYDAKDAIRHWVDRDKALDGLVRDYVGDVAKHPNGSRVALAHRRVDVHEINLRIRTACKDVGDLAGDDVSFHTRDGERTFAPGDRFVFLENNRDMDVKNGMLGTVRAPDRIDVQLDAAGGDQARVVSVDVGRYNAFDYGYALTIHKTQGATVDRAFVFASGSMDRNLTYVAMTRHREAATLYVDRQEFPNQATLVKRLGRDGSKETTLDYVEAFKERRGIGGVVDRAIERLKGLEVPQRIADLVETLRAKVSVGATSRPAVDDANKPFREALDRFAIAYADVARMDGKPATYQAARFKAATESLDRLQPGTVATLRSALKHDLQARVDTTTIKGPKRVDVLVAAIAREKTAILDPAVRAKRFVSRWTSQQNGYAALHDDYRRIDERKVAISRLNGLIQELAADKPMVAAIQANPGRFGLDPRTPLAQAMRTDNPVRELAIGLEHGFAPPSRGFSM